VLSEDLKKSLFDLSCVDGYSRLPHLFHLVFVELHKLNIWVSLDRLHLVIDHLVVAVDAIDVLEQAVKDTGRRRDA